MGWTDFNFNKMNRLIFSSLRRFTTQDQRVPHLYQQMREVALGIQDYNFREYFLRKVKEVGTNKPRILRKLTKTNSTANLSTNKWRN